MWPALFYRLVSDNFRSPDHHGFDVFNVRATCSPNCHFYDKEFVLGSVGYHFGEHFETVEDATFSLNYVTTGLIQEACPPGLRSTWGRFPFTDGHKLKIQSGLDYADMKDSANDGGAYQGWTWTTGFRLSWSWLQVFEEKAKIGRPCRRGAPAVSATTDQV